MAFRSTKHKNVQNFTMLLNGGLNLSQSPANIGDSELKRSVNFIYDPITDYIMARPGTSCQTAAVCDGTHPILRGYYYEKSTSVGYHVCACNGNLYYLTGVDLDTLTLIGALSDSTTTPAFITYNGKLLIGDGGGIKTWDGTTLSDIASSPKANALTVIKGRVVANATDELDSVYLSAPYDAESADAWDTTKTCVGLKAGYGDLLAVNGFAVRGDDLIISKVGNQAKRLYRVNVADATTTNWHVSQVSENNAAQNARSIIGAWNNIYIIDTDGFKSLTGTDTYGDLAIDPIGRKINSLFKEDYECDNLTYIPPYNAIWFNLTDRVFCYTERFIDGKIVPAFTDLAFKWGRCTSIYMVGDDVFLTGYNGYLYKLDETLSTDEVSPGVTETYTCIIRTKTYTFMVDGVLRKLQYYLKPKIAGTATISVYTAYDNSTLLKSITLTTAGEYLYDATEEVNSATEELFESSTSSWTETTRNRIRSDEMSFELEITTGRCGVEWCKAEIASLEGGE